MHAEDGEPMAGCEYCGFPLGDYVKWLSDKDNPNEKLNVGDYVCENCGAVLTTDESS